MLIKERLKGIYKNYRLGKLNKSKLNIYKRDYKIRR